MKSISFTKMQALGNDFVVIHAAESPWPLSTEVITSMADRHRGIGFDQLLVLEPSQNKSTHFHWRIFNADGSEAEQCGNGARAIALYIHEKKLAAGNDWRVSTIKAEIDLHFKTAEAISVNMGAPQLAPLPSPLKENFSELHFFPEVIQIGNPHVVCFVKTIDVAVVERLGKKIAYHTVFPAGVNVEFVQIKNPQEIVMQVYERGAGMTAACGSGACAAMVAARQKKEAGEKVTVHQPGGDLNIEWRGASYPILQTGSAQVVFEGNYFL